MEREDRLTPEQGRYLIDVARKTIEKALRKTPVEPGSTGGRPDTGVFRERRGTFVTLTRDGQLRGCIGHIAAQAPLIESVRENALSAAFRDPRFRPLSADEVDRIAIEVSILTEPQLMAYADAAELLAKLRPGVDGLIIKKGYHQATFLPQVWEQLPRKEEFLAHLCLKAGLDAEAWRKGDLEVLTYQVQAFEEES
ncbi:Protein Mbar_A1807 [uncultured Desulfatiglans sp.]|uniref:Protein Mbar_A1807 n=1 Tax=Uncultured Desulfatiglans sp. TaxID=1748965 RepID=A0A653A1Y0_UNCDX|nr:Protein Mbar_A1807 [uncultured Desulfatiglans sp.]